MIGIIIAIIIGVVVLGVVGILKYKPNKTDKVYKMNQSKSRIGVCTVNVNVSTYSSRYKDLKVKVKMLEEYGDEVVVKPIDILTPNLDSYELSEASNNLSDKIVIKKSKVTWANYSKDIVLDVDDIMLLLNGEELTFNDSKIKAKKGITTNELLDMIINKV